MEKKYVAFFFLVLVLLINPVYAGDRTELKLDSEIYKGLGAQMKITLTAPSLNKNIREPDVSLVNITTSDNGAGISFLLTETGKSTGVFTGELRFSLSSSDSELRTIKVRNGVKLFVRSAGLMSEAVWVPYDALLKLDSDKYRGLGDLPMITLTEHDLNAMPNKVEEVRVHVKSSTDTQGIYVILKENAADSGIFKGSVRLAADSSDPEAESLHIKYNDIITVTYRDTTTTSGSSKLCTAVAVWRPQTATVKLSKDSFSGLNSRCEITVTDSDMNINSDRIDTVSVKVVSGIDRTGISVKLYETKTDSGIFSGEIYFSKYSSSSAAYTIKIGSITDIKVIYTDEWNEQNEKNTTIEASAGFQYAEGSLSIEGKATSGLDGSIAITVNDPDADVSRQWDTLPVKITYGSGRKDLILQLEETGASTGIFKGTLFFSEKLVKDKEKEASAIVIPQGEEIEIIYNDYTVPGDLYKALKANYTWSYQEAQVRLDKDSYSGYNTEAGITIDDIEANSDPEVIDKVLVKISGTSTPEFSMYISETTADSGQFKGKIYFGRQEKRSQGMLKVKSGDIITVAYEDQGIRNSGTAVASASWSPQNAELKLDREIYYGNGSEVSITVKDWDMANNAAEKDIVTISVAFGGKEVIPKLILRETGNNTGIFAGTLAINAANSNYLKLQLEDGDRLQVKYTDKDNTEGTDVIRKASAIWKLKK